MQNVIPPTPTYSLPVSNFGAINAIFNCVVPGSNPVQYQDYPEGYSLALILGTPDNILATETAVITGSAAAVSIPASVANTIPANTLWAVVVTTDAGVPLTAMNGTVTRYDGN